MPDDTTVVPFKPTLVPQSDRGPIPDINFPTMMDWASMLNGRRLAKVFIVVMDEDDAVGHYSDGMNMMEAIDMLHISQNLITAQTVFTND